MQPMLTIALRAARKAGELIVRASENLDVVKVTEKGVNDYVTEVDKQAEAEIVYHLQKAYPDHGITGEEGAHQEAAEGCEYEWIIDPLDGTLNFIRGIPHYAVSIACLYRGKLQHAVVLDPIRREEFTASRGNGASLNGRRIRVTQTRNLEDALLATGIPFKGRTEAHMASYIQGMAELSIQSNGIRRAGSASLDLAYVAAGRVDAFWEFGLQPWDTAAGVLLIKEAGGLVSDIDGSDNFLKSGNICAGTPKIFKTVLKTVRPKAN